MSVFEIFKRTAVRRLTLLFIALLLGWFGLGKAHAQDVSYCSDMSQLGDTLNVYCQTQQDAFHYANQIAAARHQTANPRPECQHFESAKYYICAFDNGFRFENAVRRYIDYCPAGTEFFESLGKCDKPCSARNADLSTTSIKWASSGDSQCIAECKYQIASDYQTRAITVTVGGVTTNAGTLHGGVWEYTGDRCPASPPPQPREDEKPKPECAAVTGQSYCMMPSGDACATSSTGRMICWRPSETGTKTDGPNTQTKTNGNESPNPPEGSQHTSSQHITTTTSTNTSTTTINTYTTTTGAPAGSTNDGTPVGSDGKPSGGSGTGGTGTGGDGDENSSGGGGDCGAPPVSSGDALLAQIAHQTWATRCAISDRNKAQDDEAADLAGQGDGLDGVTEEGIFKSFEVGDLREDLLGGGGGTCSFGVPLELMGEPIELPPAFWSLASWIGMLVTASAYLWVAQKLGS